MENYLGIIAGAIVAVFLICYYLNRELTATKSQVVTLGNALNLLVPKPAPVIVAQRPVMEPVITAEPVVEEEVIDADAENKED